MVIQTNNFPSSIRSKKSLQLLTFHNSEFHKKLDERSLSKAYVLWMCLIISITKMYKYNSMTYYKWNYEINFHYNSIPQKNFWVLYFPSLQLTNKAPTKWYEKKNSSSNSSINYKHCVNKLLEFNYETDVVFQILTKRINIVTPIQ